MAIYGVRTDLAPCKVYYIPRDMGYSPSASRDMGYGIWDIAHGIWDIAHEIRDIAYGIRDIAALPAPGSCGIWDIETRDIPCPGRSSCAWRHTLGAIMHAKA